MTSSRVTGWSLFVLASLPAAFAVTSQAADGACPRTSTAQPAASPSPGALPAPFTAPSPTPSPEPQFYEMDDEVYTADRDVTAYYYFQGNRDNSAKVKQELRYDRNLSNTCAQVQIRLPYITRFPNAPNSFSPNANPFSGFGNAELRYFYSVAAPTFNHTITAGVAFPTESNGVESIDTQIKLFYATKWKWKGGSVSYTNEFDQSIIVPPGASETSYYEGLLNVPEVSFIDTPAARGVKLSAVYNFRVFFNGGPYKGAAGINIFGNIHDVALNFVDTWGLGQNGLWKYKFEASAVTRF